ncbi:MAG TPA: DUF362 domain-containing protein [Bryobacteraceae bacterium]|nr:DUF362 domain-containing protein [Bryobacteraceae bacterium]
MERRTFLQAAAAAPAALAAELHQDLPKYRIVTRLKPAAHPGMPGTYPGKVARVHAEKSIDPESEKVDTPVVRDMISRGMCALTGDADARDSWSRFFSPSDVVGIKLNCSGAPGIMSTPEIVAEIVRNLNTVGVKPEQIWLYERFPNQVSSVHYDRYVPQGVNIWTAEHMRGSIAGYDPEVYVEVDFFGEDDTRSNLARVVSQKFTKIINVPNVKDHGAAGVTGCLKNIAYGSFSNVARSHSGFKTNTYSFIGTLASVEPLRSRTVLHIMDGLRGVWHGGPFSPSRKFRFYPRLMMFGTDPVAVDRLELDVIDDKRKAEHAISVWDRSMKNVKPGRDYDENPSINRFIREPGHIEYASSLGLGVYDINKIKVTKIEV